MKTMSLEEIAEWLNTADFATAYDSRNKIDAVNSLCNHIDSERRLFVAMAMQGLCANPNVVSPSYGFGGKPTGLGWNDGLYAAACKIAKLQIALLNNGGEG